MSNRIEQVGERPIPIPNIDPCVHPPSHQMWDRMAGSHLAGLICPLYKRTSGNTNH